MANRKNEIINCIQSISGKYSAYEVFSDWIRCMAMSISNALMITHGKLWQDREQTYLDTIRRYDPGEQKAMYEMTAWLAETMEDGPDDVLGDVYMSSGMGNKATGQFFTPFHLSCLTARMAMQDCVNNYDGEIIELNEPSCGGGGMIIAAAKVLSDAGINYQRRMKVVAQDLDWKGVYMCYVQLSLLGINAICVQGDTLQEPFDLAKTERSHMLFTPASMGVLV